MATRYLIILEVLVIGLLVPFLVFGQEFPLPTGYVNDFAKMLSREERFSLENRLRDLEAKSGSEIAILTIPSLQGENLEDYSVRLFEKWRIGKKGLDNGLVILVVRDERKVRIEIGYGLEPIITDGRAGEIIRETIVPNFKRGKYEEGLKQAVDEIEKLILSHNLENPLKNPGKKALKIIFSDLIIIPLLLFIYIPTYLARTKGFWLGGVLGGIVGGVFGFILTWNFLTSLFFTGIAGVLGLLLDLVLSKNYQKMKARGESPNFFHSVGGFWPGRKGGGFGGFGGGLSGGGGASGDW